MGDFSSFGKMIMLIGVILLAVGLFITFAGKILPLGRLPGDIFVRKGNFTFYFPIVTSILLSIILTLVLKILGRK